MKIALVGPVYPYKGGIAHYTGLMYKALSKKHEVGMISYKMQYPKMLFKKEQKDYANDSFKIEDTKYLINTANPASVLATASKIKEMNPDLVIIQWWHPYFSPCYTILTSALKGIPIMYVCHNVFPHERFKMDKQLTNAALKSGNMFILHSLEDRDDLMSIKENALNTVTPLPLFDAFKMQGISKEAARDILGIEPDEKILLFFGFVREYKGLKHLIKAMPKIKEQTGARLYIVGEFGEFEEEYRRLICDLEVGDCVNTICGYVPDTEVEKYFAASDVVMLPYESATQSGIAQIAFSFEKPVIATNVGGLPEVVEDGKTGLLIEPFDTDAIADAVKRFYESDTEQFAENVRKEAYRFSWDRMTDAIEELYEKYITPAEIEEAEEQK